MIAAVALLTIGLVAMASNGSGNSAGAGRAIAPAPDPALGRLGVFGRARGPADALPALARRSVAAQPDRLGQNPELSRVVRLPSGPRYLVPGRGVVNFVTASGAGAVLDPGDVAAGRATGTEMCAGGMGAGATRVVGLLPDEARDPAVVLRNGTRFTLAVRDNAYELELNPRDAGQLPATVQFTSGEELVSVPVPGVDDDVLTLRCAGP